VFRKKWKEDKGYCSLFEKLSSYKSAMERSRERAATSASMSHHHHKVNSTSPARVSSSCSALRARRASTSLAQRAAAAGAGGPPVVDITVKGQPATFYNPVQNNHEGNLNLFIE